MKPRDFCYWLQGFMELHEENSITPKQLKIIKEHLALVFQKQTQEATEEYRLIIN